jgi:hypothetical protein
MAEVRSALVSMSGFLFWAFGVHQGRASVSSQLLDSPRGAPGSTMQSPLGIGEVIHGAPGDPTRRTDCGLSDRHDQEGA